MRAGSFYDSSPGEPTGRLRVNGIFSLGIEGAHDDSIEQIRLLRLASVVEDTVALCNGFCPTLPSDQRFLLGSILQHNRCRSCGASQSSLCG